MPGGAAISLYLQFDLATNMGEISDFGWRSVRWAHNTLVFYLSVPFVGSLRPPIPNPVHFTQTYCASRQHIVI